MLLFWRISTCRPRIYDCRKSSVTAAIPRVAETSGARPTDRGTTNCPRGRNSRRWGWCSRNFSLSYLYWCWLRPRLHLEFDVRYLLPILGHRTSAKENAAFNASDIWATAWVALSTDGGMLKKLCTPPSYRVHVVTTPAACSRPA
jgi:hypothetical protein